MGRILCKQTEIAPRRSLDTFRQPVEAPPESRRSPMHLEVFESAMIAGVTGLFDEEVEGTGL